MIALHALMSGLAAKAQAGEFATGALAAGASLNLGQQAIDSDYASVTERSGIEAGDGGFQVNVAGDTTLIGAAIASTGGDLTLVDLENPGQPSPA